MPILGSFTGARSFGVTAASGPSIINRLVVSTVTGKTLSKTYSGSVQTSATNVSVNPIDSNNKIIIGTYWDSQTVYRSVDGINWSSVSVLNYGATANVVAGPINLLLFHNGTTTYQTSTDAIAWTARTLPISVSYPVAEYGADKYVVLSAGSSSYAYSTTGLSGWTSATLPTSGFWRTVKYINGKFFAIASNTTTYVYSSDGVSWSTGTFPIDNAWGDIAYGNGIYVVTGLTTLSASHTYLTSTNGINWTQRSFFGSRPHTEVAFADGYFWCLDLYSPTAWFRSSDAVSWTSITTNTYTGDMNGATIINTAN